MVIQVPKIIRIPKKELHRIMSKNYRTRNRSRISNRILRNWALGDCSLSVLKFVCRDAERDCATAATAGAASRR